MSSETHLIDYELDGKVALITGVGRRCGIGRAIACALATVGVDIFTTYYRAGDGPDADIEEADRIVAELRNMGVRAVGLEADLAKLETPRILFDRAEAALGPVDILINNATLDIPCDIYALTGRLLDAHYEVNVRGAGLLCAEFARRRNGRLGGRIINLTSGQGIDPMPGSLPYAITKGAVEAMTMSLAATMTAKNVTVNAVDPGATDTGWISDALRSQLASKTLNTRVGSPEDAARVILYLCSSQAGWVTGQVIRSRGGA